MFDIIPNIYLVRCFNDYIYKNKMFSFSLKCIVLRNVLLMEYVAAGMYC